MCGPHADPYSRFLPKVETAYNLHLPLQVDHFDHELVGLATSMLRVPPASRVPCSGVLVHERHDRYLGHLESMLVGFVLSQCGECAEKCLHAGSCANMFESEVKCMSKLRVALSIRFFRLVVVRGRHRLAFCAGVWASIG